AADEAVRHYDRLPLPFELGRTLLVRGAVQRRDKRKREARDTLTQALEVFGSLGAALWSERTRAELARIGGRAASSLTLTPTEAGVAELVPAGGPNREVADALFVSVHTVEANLKRIYRKLGIRSRTELASTFPSRPSGSGARPTGRGPERYGFRGFLGSVLSLASGSEIGTRGKGGIMSTKAGTIGFSRRPALFTFWSVTVSVLAATALILSALALNVAGRGDGSVTSVAGSGTREGATLGAAVWDAGKLEAMQGRMLAEAVRAEGTAAVWDAGKLEAMRGRVLAETVRPEGTAALWDAGKLEAMRGRVLAEAVRPEGTAAPLWDAGKLQAMEGRVLAGY